MASNLLNATEFAARQAWSPSYVTKLKKAGRLVLEGNKIRVKESLELIDQTSGNRDDVARRHSSERDGGDLPSSQADKDSFKDAQRTKAMAESRRVVALADKEEMERDRLAGRLLDREDVDAAMKFIGATVRSLHDVFPDQTAPLVAPVASIEECHAILSEQCRNVLVSLGEAIEKQRTDLQKEAV